jgi:hypothetical protein
LSAPTYSLPVSLDIDPSSHGRGGALSGLDIVLRTPREDGGLAKD